MTVFVKLRAVLGAVALLALAGPAAAQGKVATGIAMPSYDNGVKVVPSMPRTPVALTEDNLQAVLIDSGYDTADQLK